MTEEDFEEMEQREKQKHDDKVRELEEERLSMQCDEISKPILNAMHELAAAMDGYTTKNGVTTLSVDYKNGILTYHNMISNKIVNVNVCGDSERGSIKDFAKTIILGGNA